MKTAIKSLLNLMGNKKRGKLIIIAALLLILVPTLSLAVPNLQIYSPQGEYDTATETWIIPYYDYELWVIGAHLEVKDVKLAFAVPDDEYEDGSIQVTWRTPSSSDYGTDYEAISTVTFIDPVLDPENLYNNRITYANYRESYATGATYGFGSGTPLAGDGAQIPPHGVFPTDFYEYFIGDFGTDEIVQNYIPGNEWGDIAYGEIKRFDVSVSGYTWVDIVAYDHVILCKNKAKYKAKYVFTPFSHDCKCCDGKCCKPIPEPATLFLLGTGLIGLGAFGRKKFNKIKA